MEYSYQLISIHFPRKSDFTLMYLIKKLYLSDLGVWFKYTLIRNFLKKTRFKPRISFILL